MPEKADGPDPKVAALADAMQPYHIATLRAQRDAAVMLGESQAAIQKAQLEEAQGHWLAKEAQKLEMQNLITRAHEEMAFARSHLHNAENWQKRGNMLAAESERVTGELGKYQTQESEMGVYVSAQGPHWQR